VAYTSCTLTCSQVSQSAFSVAYGTGSVKGVQGTDTVHLGSISVPLTFGLAQSVSDEFLSYPMDGILGLGRPDTVKSGTTGVNAPSLMDTLISQKIISSKLYGLALWRSADGGSNDGEINFGSPDTSRYDGNLNYISAITSTNGFWEIPIADAGVDGKKVGLTGRTAIIDSGTSFILMPKSDAAKLHQAIPNSSQNGETFTVPCDATNKVQIVFGSITYNISPKDYVGSPSGSDCASNIIGRQVFSSSQWLVGDVFLKNVYTVFDYDQQRVGLGVKGASVSKVATTTAGDAKSTQSMLFYTLNPLLPKHPPHSFPSIRAEVHPHYLLSQMHYRHSHQSLTLPLQHLSHNPPQPKLKPHHRLKQDQYLPPIQAAPHFRTQQHQALSQVLGTNNLLLSSREEQTHLQHPYLDLELRLQQARRVVQRRVLQQRPRHRFWMLS
jgi:hypothetical protein